MFKRLEVTRRGGGRETYIHHALKAIGLVVGDFIIVDECHRSIYDLWSQVLLYFDSFIIGLTATPAGKTIGFFNQNLVMWRLEHEHLAVPPFERGNAQAQFGIAK